MQLIAPDILAEADGLSVGASAIGLTVGLALWLTGWTIHRFWIVLFTTITAGFVGLQSGRVVGVQPLVVAILLAVAAGLMALALVRVAAFVAGGLAAWLAVHHFAPTWNEPIITFLAGGLAGLLLFRLWTMTLTSLAGTLLAAYSMLALLDRLGKVDAVAWSDSHAVMLNWYCGGSVVLGLLAQFILDRWWTGREKRQKQKALSYLSEEERDHVKKMQRRQPWFKFGKKQAA